MDPALLGEIDRARTRPGKQAFTPAANLPRLIAEQVETAPDREFLVFFDEDRAVTRRWSYREIGGAVARTAGLLRELGVGRGDRIAFLIGNLDHAIALYLATWALGACVAPLSAAETRERKAFILENSGASLLFARASYRAEAEELVAAHGVRLIVVDDESDAEDCYPRLAESAPHLTLADQDFSAIGAEALLVYTSGTTGPPKGVRIDQRNMLANAHAIASWHGYDETLRAMCVLPIHHVNGIIVTHMTPLYSGGTALLCARFNSRTFFERVAAESVTMVSVVPTLLEFLIEAGPTNVDHSSLETIICGAGPLLVETAAAFEEMFGIPITHGYGLSETTCYNCHLPRDLSDRERRAWLTEHGFPSIGVALPYQELSIRGEGGTGLPPGERGEICIRGDSVSLGYHDRDDANADAFKGGWFHSGDEGFWLPGQRGRAFFFITGRLKELIIRGGINYAPLEIDEVLNAHPDVRYGLAVPFANRYYGDEIAAYVVPQDRAQLDSEALLAFCRERLDFAKCPKVVIQGEEIPYTTTGKPKRIELSRQLAGELAPYRDVQFRRPDR